MTFKKQILKTKLKDYVAAEFFVASYYKKIGYSLLCHQYRSIGSEIDLICAKEDTLRFIEVKLRKNWPTSLVDFQQILPLTKQKHLKRGIKNYLGRSHEKYFENLCFDLVVVKRNPSLLLSKKRKFLGLKVYKNLDLFTEE